MMRVLFLFPDRLDPNHYQGGVAEFILALTPELKTLGITSTIYTKDRTHIAGPIVLAEGIEQFNGPYIKPGLFYSRKNLAVVLALCQQKQFDVIHAQGTYAAGFMALQIYKRTHIPYVVTSHSDILPTNSKRIRRKRVQKRCQEVLKYAAAVTHLTPMMAEASHQLSDTKEKSTLISNGINCAAWEPYAALPEENYLLSIGRLEDGKGFHVLIDMYAKLLEHGITAPLVIAGKGSAEQKLHLQARQLGLNLITDCNDLTHFPEKSVIFTGYVRGKAKMSLIARSRCILFATQPALWDEAFGIVLLEAMAAGKPLITSDITVTRYLKTLGLQAVMVKAEAPLAWATAAVQLLQDTQLRNQMSQKNLGNAKQFDWQLIAEQYQKVYLSAAS